MKDENRELFLEPEALRGCTDEQLENVISEGEQRIYEIRQQSMHGNKVDIKQPHQIKALKKQIARCKTILRERYL